MSEIGLVLRGAISSPFGKIYVPFCQPVAFVIVLRVRFPLSCKWLASQELGFTDKFTGVVIKLRHNEVKPINSATGANFDIRLTLASSSTSGRFWVVSCKASTTALSPCLIRLK